ncbi:MAG: Rieske 2Fe-2S domain-containing protein [Rugosibacter sp.]|nr:Rieske 2Fe-2S domain-containing protein [Rugosibacter sp.]MDD3381592.1 Rieske 2Fe-2S domain-containing protein [Rugosibacter sp.]
MNAPMTQFAKPWVANPDGYRVPYEVFTDQAYYDQEQEHIFRGETWSFVGLDAELPNNGDFKSTAIGDTPVIVTRDQTGQLHVFKNLCMHRGALLVRESRGNVKSFDCVYHQWSFDLTGALRGVPMRRGVRGEGGMPPAFDMANFGLDALRVEVMNGLIFASFSKTVEPLADYLGEGIVANIQRIFNRPIRIMGDYRQYIHGNWKLYAENTRDAYHGSLLHLFHSTFGLYRATQKGFTYMDPSNRHSLLKATASAAPTSASEDQEVYKDVRSYNTEFRLQDASILAGRPEFEDRASLVINAIFPNLLIQQIANCLAVRQSVTHAPNAFEIVWTLFGYADDDEEMQMIRMKQSNLVGPAGLISMEDGEAIEIVQDAVIRDGKKTSVLAMGGVHSGSVDHMITEGTIIGFWENYARYLSLGRELKK